MSDDGRYPVVVTELRFAHEPDASRYTLHRGDDLVSVLDYRDDGRTVAMTRAYTVPTFRGHGYAGELVDRAVARTRAQRRPRGDPGLLVRRGLVHAPTPAGAASFTRRRSA